MRRAGIVAKGLVLALAVVVGTGAGQGAWAQGRSGADEEEQAFQGAESAFRENNDEEAARLYDKVLALNPSRSDAYIKRSIIFYKKKQFTEAVTLLRKGQQILPGDEAIKAQLGLSLYKSGAADVAVTMMEEVVAKNPKIYQVQLQLGQHYAKLQDGKKAAVALEAYFANRPPEAAAADVQIRVLLGTAYLYDRRYPDAQREFETVLREKPNDLASKITLATVFAAAGDCAKAVPAFERVLGEAPRAPSIYYNLGSCYLKVNRRADAEKTADTYTKAKPGDVRGWILLGDAKLQNRDYAGALGAFQSAQKADPQATVEARLGKVHVAQKNYPAALAVLEPAHKKRGDDIEVTTQLAEVYAATRPDDKELLVKVVGELAKAEALPASGVAYYVAGNDPLAEKSFSAAVAADARAIRPRSGLLMTLNRSASRALSAGDLAGAEALLVRAQKLDPDSVQTNRNLGLVLLLEKKAAEAEKPLQVAVKKVPKDLVVNRLLGRAYVALGKPAEALRAYQAAEAVATQARGAVLAQVYTEMGPLHAEKGNVDEAVRVLETAIKEAGKDAQLSRAAQRNLALAYYRRGLERMKDARQLEPALEDLTRASATPRPALSSKELAAVDCALGVAALRASKLPLAQDSFSRATKEGCQFAAPYDKVGIEFFNAYAQYRGATEPGRREGAIKTFNKLLPKAGPLADLLRELVRSAWELEGYDWYTRNEPKRSSLALKAAAKVTTKGDRNRLDHNLAVIDLNDGKTAVAERVFEQLGQRPPEALLNLGILRDRQGDAKKALELYRRAAERGVRAPKLREWIDVKERLLSSGATAQVSPREVAR